MDAKIYQWDEYSWYATNWDLDETIKWYQENITEMEPESIDDIEECDLDKDGVWVETTDLADIEKIGDMENFSFSPHEKTFGDLRRHGYSVTKWTSFREALKAYEGFTEPFEIASTEF